MGEDVISKIVFVCSDMWEPYLKLIRENCSEALHILDRFHIVANMNKALDHVRAEETSRMKREGRAPVLKKSRWLLLRGAAYPGPLPHRRQYEQGTRPCPCRGNKPHETRGPRPGPQEVPLAAAPPQREPRRRPALPVARSPSLQPQDRPRLPS